MGESRLPFLTPLWAEVAAAPDRKSGLLGLATLSLVVRAYTSHVTRDLACGKTRLTFYCQVVRSKEVGTG